MRTAVVRHHLGLRLEICGQKERRGKGCKSDRQHSTSVTSRRQGACAWEPREGQAEFRTGRSGGFGLCLMTDGLFLGVTLLALEIH